MQTIKNSKNSKLINILSDNRPIAVALGNFDGLHIAHMQVIDAAIVYANKNHMHSMVYTFIEHPKNVTEKKEVISYITPIEQKEALLAKTKLDILYFDTFTEDMMKIQPREFLDNLKQKFCVRFISVGYNYTFGYMAKGNVAFLKQWCLENSVDLFVAKPVYLDGKLVSSTRIRKAIAAGQVELARHMLGRPYFVSGLVERGHQLGSSLGFPTINTHVLTCSVLPKFGVYITRTMIDGAQHKSITNVGIKPTIGTHELTIETYIVDFEGDLYGKNIRVDFLEYLRSEKKFSTYASLTTQIAKDVEKARLYEIS